LSPSGSSPRLRGTLLCAAVVSGARRFIPAPAGNTGAAQHAGRYHAVHPRACGEHVPDEVSTMPGAGSSPRLRGTPSQRYVPPLAWRFIPAPAGNTGSTEANAAQNQVHPRACGEHSATTKGGLPADGSSPRLRGTRLVDPTFSARSRFIPAPAGNTATLAGTAVEGAVHPRACGEHLSQIRTSASAVGSSPRLRGTPPPKAGSGVVFRFIPAPAGNTRYLRAGRVLQQVHPRACGEHLISAARFEGISGSSPRLRGTPGVAASG